MKIAINGFGRIGRATLKNLLEKHPEIEVVAINDLTDPDTLAHLFKHDSIYGIYPGEVKFDEDEIFIKNNSIDARIKIFAERDPEKLPWGKLGVDVVLECTGIFRKRIDAEKHLRAGAKKVVISAPAKDKDIPSFVLGVNEEKFDFKNDNIVDMASCTTNCLAPIVKVIQDEFGIKRGFMTTIHSYTSDQRILDAPHSDLRRSRAAALNIVPTTTGATTSVCKVIEGLEGKLDGMAFRVPTPTVSVVDFVCETEKEVSAEEINIAFLKAGEGKMKGILSCEEKPLVSSDFIGNSYSSIVDVSLTKSENGLIKVISWYDNEWGYSSRLADFCAFISSKM
jgi:glyceraldehyde 3-phosphate dehydrogenase (phosphorylating)